MFKKDTGLSTGILQDFVPDVVDQFGLPGKITCMAYDSVQSLAGIGMETGLVHILGEGTIQRTFVIKKAQPVRYIRFVKSVYLVVIDDSNVITTWDLNSGEEWSKYQSAATISAVHTDPAMDWLFLGHHNGTTTVFDIDRGHIAPFKIENLERIVNSNNRMGYVQALSLNPRDPSLLLICYRDVAVVWSIARGEIAFDMVHEFPVHQAVWHPSGSHIVTSHVNGALVFWDGSKGVKLGTRLAFGEEGPKDGVTVTWCCREDPVDTFLLVSSMRACRVIDYGLTPVVTVTSYEAMGAFFSGGQDSPDVLFPTICKAWPVVLSEAGKPHHNGNQNPCAAIFHLEDSHQEFLIVQLPQLRRIELDSSILPPVLAWRSADRTFATLEVIPRTQWLGMMAVAPRHVLKGGRTATRNIRRQTLSAAVVVGFADGTVKLFDGTNADSRDHRVISTTIRGVKPDEVPISASLAGAAGELAVAAASGNVYLMTFKKNSHPGIGIGMSRLKLDDSEGSIQRIDHEAPIELREGFIPMFLVHSTMKCTALCNSNIGFVGIGREENSSGSGRVTIVDRRGPATILDEPIKGTPTFIEFGIMALATDPYSSIIMSVGTSRGEVTVYKVLPRPQGGFFAQSAFSFSAGSSNHPVIHIAHIDTGEGKSATAHPDVMSRLAGGIVVLGAILAVTTKEARFMSVTGSKGATKIGSKNFDTQLLGAGYTYIRWGQSSALVTVNVKGKTGVYGLPGLSTISTFPAPRKVCPTAAVSVTEMGDVFIPTDPSLACGYMMRIWGSGEELKQDEVFSLRKKVPARPTISTVTWVKGTQFVKVEDVDKLVGGTKRGKSRRGNQVLVESAQTNTVTDSQAGIDGKSNSWKWTGGFKHNVRKSPKLQKSWGQTLDEYYNAAETAVNDALDQGVQSMRSSQSDATKSAMSGIIGAKLGF